VVLSDQDWKHIETIIDLAIERAATMRREAIAEAMAQHIANCPQVKRVRYVLIGVGIGVTLVTGSAGAVLAKVAGLF